jgi:hypothetical protein
MQKERRCQAMRLIDADKMNLLLGISDRDIYAKRMLDHMDTVDAVPVVRCKDCKYLVNATVNDNGFLICDINDMEIAPDDFCSYGEPKEGTHADDHD